MPSSRQFRVIGFVTVLAIMIIYYVSNGASSTHESPFYKSTLDAIQNRKNAESRQGAITDEPSRQEIVERLRKEHEAAVSTVMNADAAAATPPQQQPFVPKEQAAKEGADEEYPAEKSVAGRMKIKDDKVVHGRPGNDAADGVAKVGNVAPKASDSTRKPNAEQSRENAEVEAELDDILKKGPIIVFSKSYCPYSKKAKHILLDLYRINPRPYVVELDTHALGPELQDQLQRLTGRRTVPNVLINGRSIGGGDDVEALHVSGALIDTVQAMGGKRVMSVLTAEEAERQDKIEVKFKS